jgi:hypothetical protein
MKFRDNFHLSVKMTDVYEQIMKMLMKTFYRPQLSSEILKIWKCVMLHIYSGLENDKSITGD